MSELGTDGAEHTVIPERTTTAGRFVDDVQSEKLLRKIGVAAFLALAVAIVSVIVAFYKSGQAESSNTAKAQAQDQTRKLYTQVATAGATPVVTPAGVPPASNIAGAPGATGATGPGPSTAQISSAVAAYCLLHSNCVGTPSQAQVAAAVRSYCATGVCRGKDATGSPGPSGQPGSDGQDAPAVSGDQIGAAVTVYCSVHGGCTGPAGPTGAQGDKGDTGKTGRGIASIDCTGLGVDSLTITYDDGTKSTVPCDIAPASPTAAATS